MEAELQRQALLLKGLLRDVAVLRDTLWHLADERSQVTEAAQEAKGASEATEELRAELRELQGEALEAQKCSEIENEACETLFGVDFQEISCYLNAI